MTEYGLYRARVEGKRVTSTNRFLCRIIPHMADIKEKDLLPDYPCFLQTDQNGYVEGDVVWVICDDDFQIGYILGICEPSIGSGIEPILRRINDAEKKANVPLSSPVNLSFHQVMDVAIDFYNRSTKQCGRILTNGTIIIFGNDSSIFIQNPRATILLTKEGTISIKAQDIEQEIKNMDLKAAEVTEVLNKLSTTVDGNAKLSVGGTYQVSAGANRVESTLGAHDTTVIGVKRETIGQGERKRIVLGGSSTLAVAGDIELKTLAGSTHVESALEVKITGTTVTISGGIVNLKGQMITTPVGSVIPSYVPGPFCALPVCPLTGLPHTGSTFISADPTVALDAIAELLIPPKV